MGPGAARAPSPGAFANPWSVNDRAAPPGEGLILFAWTREGGNDHLYRTGAMSRLDATPSGMTCQGAWDAEGQEIGGEEFCAGAAESSACVGASGGPLFSSTAGGSGPEPLKLVGILSKADNSCDGPQDPDEEVFDVYTKVTTSWIRLIMQNDSATQDKSRERCRLGLPAPP